MFNLVPFLSTILPIIASGLLILVVAINLYVKIRRQFPISVNCWFCNSWTRVPYDNWNSFDCPNCLQYNGFTKGGDYNKVIPEQRDEFMNKSTQMKCSQNIVTNGLCTLCNNNQQLKIFQLAHFVPLVEDNYDVEIEHFKEQVEKAYKLCKRCDRVLKRTIDQQNAWLFGNRVKSLCNNGIASVHKFTSDLKQGAWKPIWSRLVEVLSLLLVLWLIFLTTLTSKLFMKNLNNLPTTYLCILKNITAIATSSRLIKLNVFDPYLPQYIKIEPYFTSCLMGLILQVITITWKKRTNTLRVNRLLCWIILLLNSWVHVNNNYASYITFVQVFCYGYLLYTTFHKDEDRKLSPKPSGKTIRRLVKNLEHTCSYISDTSGFENSSSSSKNDTDCSDCFSKSTFSTVQLPESNVNFTTANSVLNSTFVSTKRPINTYDSDLNRSLNNLHLGGLHIKPPAQSYSVASFNVKRPRPVLSPPKLQTTMNSWIAGGFWRNSEGIVMPIARPTNCSRSSSESSGFGSQQNENWPFAPPKNVYYGDFDKGSIHSEFANMRTSPTCFTQSEFGRSADFRNNGFNPYLQHNNMLILGNRNFLSSPSLIRSNEAYQRKGLFENWPERNQM